MHDTLESPLGPSPEAVELSSERAYPMPEVIANPPLENTSVVYSIPIKGEWTNGNTLRMLRARFSQQTEPGECCEIEIVANIGPGLDDLVVKGADWTPLSDDHGYLIQKQPNYGGDDTLEQLEQMKAPVDYLTKLIECQALAQIVHSNPNDTDARERLDQALSQTTDPLEKEVLELAVKKSQTISLALIDATHMAFNDTFYRTPTMASLRTLGGDVAQARFGANAAVVLCLSDADTVPATNHEVRDLQRLYRDNDNLHFAFSGLAHMPAGHTADFVADAPRGNVQRTWAYNSHPARNTTQISLRLGAYGGIQEIAGWTYTGFQGDEDRDTSYRLIYHFGNLQDGLLFGADQILGTAMSGDRLDGSFDSAGRKRSFEQQGAQGVEADMSQVLTLQSKVEGLIAGQPAEQQQAMLEFLQKLRTHYEKEERLQQRFNRLVLGTFVDAVEAGSITLDQDTDTIAIADDHVKSMHGGNALRHYIAAHPEVAKSILRSPNDIAVIAYLLGREDALPQGVETLTPFQLAIREYVGEVVPLSALISQGLLRTQEDTAARQQVEDLRPVDSKVSIMHGAVAETLALGYAYGALFQTDEFLASRGRNEAVRANWPEDPGEQRLDMHFGSQAERVQAIKRAYPDIDGGTAQPRSEVRQTLGRVASL